MERRRGQAARLFIIIAETTNKGGCMASAAVPSFTIYYSTDKDFLRQHICYNVQVARKCLKWLEDNKWRVIQVDPPLPADKPLGQEQKFVVHYATKKCPAAQETFSSPAAAAKFIKRLKKKKDWQLINVLPPLPVEEKNNKPLPKRRRFQSLRR